MVRWQPAQLCCPLLCSHAISLHIAVCALVQMTENIVDRVLAIEVRVVQAAFWHDFDSFWVHVVSFEGYSYQPVTKCHQYPCANLLRSTRQKVPWVYGLVWSVWNSCKCAYLWFLFKWFKIRWYCFGIPTWLIVQVLVVAKRRRYMPNLWDSNFHYESVTIQ